MMRAALVACLAMGYRSGARGSTSRSTRSRSTCCARPTCAASSASRTCRSAGSGSSSTCCIASPRPEADVRRVVETADRLSPLLANLSPAIERVHRLRIVHARRRPDMDARVFRRVQRYGWDAATNAYDRGWVPVLEAADRIVRRARGAARRASGCWIWRPGPASARSRRRARSATAGAVTGHRRVGEDGRRWRACAPRTRGVRNVVFQRHDMEATGARRRRVRRGHLRVRPDVRRRSRGRVRRDRPRDRARRAGVGLRLGAARRLRLRGGVPDRRRPRRERGLPAVLRARGPGRADRVVRAGRADGRGRGDASR